MADKADSVFIYDPLEISPRSVSQDHYWQRYGLKQSPFDDNSHFAMYYPAPHWQKPLNFLLQFCSGSQVMGIVEGELGIGKSMLVAQVIAQLDENVEYCQIEGKTGISVTQLIARIAESFNLSRNLDQATWHEQLQSELALLQQRQKVGLLIIDDADRLPGETLTALIDLAAMQRSDQIRLYIILTSELQLGEYLENIAQEQGRPLHIPTVALTHLNLDETKNYIKHRLIKAGLTEKLPFSNDMIAKIYHLSRGFPGRINRVAQQMLIDMLKPNEERLPLVNQPQNKSRLLWQTHNVKIISLMLLIAMIAVLWKMQPEIGKMTHRSIAADKPEITTAAITVQSAPTMPQTQPVQPAANTMAPAPLAVATPVIAQQPTMTANNAAPATTTQLQPQPPASLQPLPNQNQVAALNPAPAVVTPVVATTDTSANTPANTADTATSVVAVAQPAARASTKPAAARNITADEKRLLAMKGFTVQLLGSRNPADLKRLVAKGKLDSAQTLQFKTEYQNKPWYVLVYGDYTSSQQAKAAIAQLPANVKGLKPWVRPLATVHNALMQNRK